MLDTNQRQEVDYFVGTEVEHTICHGKKTLFVVGVKPVEDIVELATRNEVDHIYFGTSQSFKPSSLEDWRAWNVMIKGCLDANYWVTLDFGVEYARDIHEDGWTEYQKFVPMISVKLPYISLYNYNTTLKIDDTTWGATNPGVWTHHLPTLLSKENYTHWEQYTNDTPV